jgi:hypothetical protein
MPKPMWPEPITTSGWTGERRLYQANFNGSRSSRWESALLDAEGGAGGGRAETSRHPPAGPEDLGLAERCILWPPAGPPMLPAGYNNNYQILQAPGYVAILIEMIHDVRIIPLDGRPHLPETSATGWETR